MIFLTLNLILSYYQEGKNVPLYVYIVFFLTCVFLLGRSGIIISTILLFYHFFLCYKKRYTLFFVLILLFIYSFYFDQILSLLDKNSNFKNGLESPRTIMVNEYLLNIFYDENQIFWGRNYSDCCSTVLAYNGNIHNSFLSGHAKYGILHTFFIILMLVYLLLSKKIFLIFIGTLILVRYYYDQLGFFGIYDITFFYLLLLSRFKKEAF
jgi:hypothetical protein